MILPVLAVIFVVALIFDDIRVRCEREELRDKLANFPRRGAGGKFEKR